MVRPVSYRELDVWKKAMQLTQEVYEFCRQISSDERYGLISQMQRSSLSIPCNIAEGFGLGAGGYRRHVSIARGSLMELEVQIELAVRLNLLDREPVARIWPLAQDLGQMLTRLRLSLKES